MRTYFYEVWEDAPGGQRLVGRYDDPSGAVAEALKSPLRDVFNRALDDWEYVHDAA